MVQLALKLRSIEKVVVKMQKVVASKESIEVEEIVTEEPIFDVIH